jgi:hypothetical protein
MSALTSYRSPLYYIAVVLVLLLGYLGGAYLAFGVPYAGRLAFITDGTGRLALSLYGMGVLGASLYSSRWWSLDLDSVMEGKTAQPNGFDVFGYLFTILGGGVTGIVFYLLGRTGMNFLSSNAAPTVSAGGGAVLALMGGLFHFRVEEVLSRLFDNLSKPKKERVASEATATTRKRATQRKQAPKATAKPAVAAKRAPAAKVPPTTNGHAGARATHSH